MASVSLRNVSKSYDGKTPVVRDVSLDVPDGQILTVLGPSGCGKSTLLRLIAGLETADTGEILIGGESVNDRDPKDRDVAMVFQSYALYPHMNVRENISVALKLRHISAPAIRERVESAAARLGLMDLLDRRPAHLSGGQRQRVALARALVRQPKAFLLDEPLSNLDAVLRERTRAELRLLFRDLQATVLYVTHDQIEAMTLSDRVAILRQGGLEQMGAPLELYQSPATEFVAGFIGSPRMNLLEAACIGRFDPHVKTAGIRPEDVQVLDQPGADTRPMALRRIEPLGAQKLLTLAIDGVEVRALVALTRPVSGTLHVRFPADRIHTFDAEGRRTD